MFYIPTQSHDWIARTRRLLIFSFFTPYKWDPWLVRFFLAMQTYIEELNEGIEVMHQV